MKHTYKSIKAYSTTLKNLEWIIIKLGMKGYHLNKVQALDLATQQLKKAVQKMKPTEDE